MGCGKWMYNQSVERQLAVDNPTTLPYRPPTSEAQNMLVSDLFLPNSTLWNVEKIKVHLPQYEAQIRKLVPSTLEMEDTLTWLYQK